MENVKDLIHFFPVENSFDELVVTEDGQRFRLNLNEDGSSWVDGFMMDPVPSQEEFETLWSLCPTEVGKIKIFGKEKDTPRYYQSYGKPYNFSGMEHPALPIPEPVQRYLDWANMMPYTRMYGLETFDEVLVNWYVDGTHGIGSHQDDEHDMRLGPNGKTNVFSITFQEYTEEKIGNRTFRMKPYTKIVEDASSRKRLGKERVDIEMPNGLVLVMGGTCQRTHTHQVPKLTKKAKPTGRRINVTFRFFK